MPPNWQYSLRLDLISLGRMFLAHHAAQHHVSSLSDTRVFQSIGTSALSKGEVAKGSMCRLADGATSGQRFRALEGLHWEALTVHDSTNRFRSWTGNGIKRASQRLRHLEEWNQLQESQVSISQLAQLKSKGDVRKRKGTCRNSALETGELHWGPYMMDDLRMT